MPTEPQKPPLKLDPDSFEELSPTDQGIALLALLFMDKAGLTLEDIMEPDHHDRTTTD